MSIYFNTEFNPDYSKVRNNNVPKSGKEAAAKAASSSSTSASSAVYDKVSFGSDSQTPDDETFIANLTSKIASELNMTASPDKVAQLKQDVQSGNYRADSQRIAERLLGYRG